MRWRQTAFRTVRRTHNRVGSVYRLARHVLLIMFVFAGGGVSLAQATAKIALDAEAAAGGLVRIAVFTTENRSLTAYLPGLAMKRYPLRYDTTTRCYRTALRVPLTAPTQGYLTLRLVANGHQESDFRVRLMPAQVHL